MFSASSIKTVCVVAVALASLATASTCIRAEPSPPKQQIAPVKDRDFHVSPNSTDADFAPYYRAFEKKVTEYGTANFPKRNGSPMYGRVLLVVTVRADGTVVSTEVLESSKNRALDAHAESVVRKSAPFEPFTERMRARADRVVIVAPFYYAKND